jgi:hypothetical protein
VSKSLCKTPPPSRCHPTWKRKGAVSKKKKEVRVWRNKQPSTLATGEKKTKRGCVFITKLRNNKWRLKDFITRVLHTMCCVKRTFQQALRAIVIFFFCFFSWKDYKSTLRLAEHHRCQNQET